MGRTRKRKDLARKQRKRPRYDRILIVCEDSKSSPNYLNEIRQFHRLHTASVHVRPSQLGTAPRQVVDYAEQLFLEGDTHKDIGKKAFEKVYAVFDRDDHTTYFDALDYAATLDKKYRNDEKQLVPFKAIASVPCFELWYLLHYENIQNWIHRYDLVQRLKTHIAGYDKGAKGYFAHTRDMLGDATERAMRLATLATAYDDDRLFTEMHILVELLNGLKK